MCGAILHCESKEGCLKKVDKDKQKYFWGHVANLTHKHKLHPMNLARHISEKSLRMCDSTTAVARAISGLSAHMTRSGTKVSKIQC